MIDQKYQELFDECFVKWVSVFGGLPWVLVYLLDVISVPKMSHSVSVLDHSSP